MEWHSGRVTNAINFLKTLHTSSERTVVSFLAPRFRPSLHLPSAACYNATAVLALMTHVGTRQIKVHAPSSCMKSPTKFACDG